MGVPSDDVVLIQKGKKPGEPHVITVNCPDKTGLGSDICRIILDFGLYITKCDVSTDGIWCYIVLWVVQYCSSLIIRWPNLKSRLLSVCPSVSASLYFNNQQPTCSTSSMVYLLKFFCLDRKGLLHDVTQLLTELELTIQRVKVTTTPDGRVLDLFFITDNMELLHTTSRQDETCEQLHAFLGESCISCELKLAGPEYDCLQGIATFSPEVAEELFAYELSDKEFHSQSLSPDMTKLKKANVTIDNSLSPAHTLLQIHCVDHKGLLYDIMRTLKDCNIQIAYGRFSPSSKGCRDIDLFIQQNDGKKILDLDKQSALCSRLKVEMLNPLRVIIANRGPDTELLVANPVELSGKGRPRVFYDVTLSLKVLGICIFSAEIGRHSTSDREWEVYRYLLDENCNFQLSSTVARNQIVDRVRRTLMGWLFGEGFAADGLVWCPRGTEIVAFVFSWKCTW
ncbi:ACT domain-containing protein [Cephalotus follicularis]|uniref:ACT domain-containing protein ACR n=1 Tax=Cephalotus follicularis TaxID=3775 RepID=A0A1Q3AQ67_CEPFO|nr:ACT domain-containing protein [Cephalotus follicularis]